MDITKQARFSVSVMALDISYKSYTRFNKRVRRMKPMATQVVALAIRASRVLALFLETKDSDPPEMAPERPERFPDCRRTVTISSKQDKTCTTVNIVLNKNYTSKIFSSGCFENQTKPSVSYHRITKISRIIWCLVCRRLQP